MMIYVQDKRASRDDDGARVSAGTKTMRWSATRICLLHEHYTHLTEETETTKGNDKR